MKLSVDQKGLGLTRAEEERNLVWYLDEGSRRWLPLFTKGDPDKGTATARTSHFTSFATGSLTGPEATPPPSLEAYQTDLCTGSARTAYTIEVPPGMGGLTPRLELTYSSLIVDELNRTISTNAGDNQSFGQQASWVGLGWDFEPGYILFSPSGPTSMRIGGRSSRLIHDGPEGSFKTEDDWFWKVLLMTGGESPSGQYCLAYDKDGTEYSFGFKAASSHGYAGVVPYRFDLDQVKDTRGNYIEYVWQEDAPLDNYDFWLSEIRYTGNGPGPNPVVSPQRKIAFGWGDRTDFVDDNGSSRNYVHRKKLENIQVFADTAGSTLVSKYVFGYGYITPTWLRWDEDGYFENAGLDKLALLSITRYGADGSQYLPATTFTYYSGASGQGSPLSNWRPWLKTANNGYGGLATYVYQYFEPIYASGSLKWRGRLASRMWEDLNVAGNTAVVYTYQYGDAYDFRETWNTLGRTEFRGHDWVIEVDSLNDYTRSWFYAFRSTGQTQNGKTDAEVHILKGRMWQQARYKWDGTLLAYDRSEYDYAVTGTDNDDQSLTYLASSYFIKLLTQDSYLGSKQKQVKYVYDNTYGNLLSEYHWGEIGGSGSERRSIHRRYDPNTTAWIIDRVSWENVFEEITENVEGPALKTQTINYYDGHTAYSDPPTVGLLTKQERGKTGVLIVATQYGYDAYGNRTSMTDPNNNTTTFDWDATYHAFLIKTTYPITSLYEERGYDLGRGLLTSVNDSNNGTGNDARTLFAYDTFGRIAAMARPGDTLETDSYGRYYKATKGFVYYDTASPYQVMTSTRKIASGAGDVTGYHTARSFYDGLGREVQRYSDYDLVPNPKANTVVNSYYDGRGLKRRETIPHTVASASGALLQDDWTAWVNQDTGTPGSDLQYDALRRPIRVTNPDGNYRETAYRDWEVASTDENRHQKKQTLDAFGRLVRVDEYTGTFQTPDLDATPYATTTYAYSILDSLTTIKDALDTNPSTTITWNELSRKTQMIDPDMGTWKYGYDSKGNLIRQEDARHKVIKIGYDALNRPRRKTYWRVENSLEVLDGNWVDDLTINGTVGIYDIAEIRAAINANLAGLESADPAKKPRTWEGLQGESDPDNRTFIAGRTTVRAPHFTEMLQAVRDLKNNQSLPFTRGPVVPGGPRTISKQDPLDLQGWVESHENGNGVAARVYFRYDDYTGTQYSNAKGRRTEMWDATGHSIWKYDTRGRIIEERRYMDGKVYVTTWTYDAMDRVMSMTYPDGETVSYTYNAQLLLDSMTGSSAYVAAGTGYNAAGLPTGVTYNGVTASMGYHAQTLRLTSISVPWPVSLTLGYEHFPNGNLSRITEGGSPTDFGYDDLDRLISAAGGFSASYVFNKIGNFWPDPNTPSKVEGGAGHTYQYSDPNHKHAPSSIDGSGQTYDENGNLIASLGISFKYNAENQLVKVTQGSGYVARFSTDGDGQRRKRVDSYGTVIYAGPHYERNVGTGADTSDVVTKLYWAQLGPFRRLIAVRKGGTLSFIHHDHLGSTKAVSGTTGGPMKYYPFGSTYQEISAPPTDNLYTGQKRDLSTGLYFYWARYYDAAIGRFTQPDTIVPNSGNPQSLNRYAYVANNPLKYTDPSGLDVMVVPGLGGEKDYDDPKDWKPWIMANTNWSEDRWNAWYGAWTAPGADRQALAGQYGVNIFNWGAVKGGSDNGSTDEAVTELNRQMGGMTDITMVAHSKGGIVAYGFMELSMQPFKRSFDRSANPRWIGVSPVAVDAFVLIDPALNWLPYMFAQARFNAQPYHLVQDVIWPAITINPTADLRFNIESWISGTIPGGFNIQSKREDHSLMVDYARTAMYLLSITPPGAQVRGF